MSNKIYFLLSLLIAIISGTAVAHTMTNSEDANIRMVEGDGIANNCRYGVAAVDLETEPWLETLGAGWYLNFNYNRESTDDYEFIRTMRIRQVKDDRGTSDPLDDIYLNGYDTVPPLSTVYYIAGMHPGSMWLVGNEPDRRDRVNAHQDDTMPDMYARAFHDVARIIRSIDPTAQIAHAATVEVTPGRLQYLDKVWDAYLARYGEPMPVDVWTMHIYILPERRQNGTPNELASIALDTDWDLAIYQSDATPAMCNFAGHEDDDVYCISEHDNIDIFQDQVVAMRQWMKDHGQQDKPLVMTEFGTLFDYVPGSCYADELGECFHPDRVSTFLEEAVNYLETATDPSIGYPADNHRLVQQWNWYSTHQDVLGGSANLLVDNYAGFPAGDVNALTQVGQEFRSLALASSLDSNLFVDAVPDATGYLPSGSNGTQVFLRATIRNNGNAAVSEPVTVTFYEDAGLTQVMGSVVIEPQLRGCARSSYEVVLPWVYTVVGDYPFWVEVDSADLIDETNEGDNVGNGVVHIWENGVFLPAIVDYPINFDTPQP